MGMVAGHCWDSGEEELIMTGSEECIPYFEATH